MNILYGISLALTPVILNRTRSLRIAANWTLSSAFAVLLFQSWVLGGVSSLAYPWLACVPMAAMLLRGVRGGAVWTLVSVIGVVGVGIADIMGLLPQGPALVVAARGATMVTIAALTLTLGGLAWLAESRAEELLQDLQRQKLVFQERAVRDWLTGLANRSLLTECLIQSWERARRHGPRGALFFIDLNDFKDGQRRARPRRPATRCCGRSRCGFRTPCGPRTSSAGSAETSSRWSSKASRARNDVAALADKVAQAIERPDRARGRRGPLSARASGSRSSRTAQCHFGDRITLPSIPAAAVTTRGEVDQESVRRLLEKADAAMYAAKRKAIALSGSTSTWRTKPSAAPTALLSEPPPAA